MNSSVIDLSRLEPPELVETINFETLLAERKAALVALYPPERQAEVAATLELESEPMVMLLQENAYREVHLRQQVNDAARALMLAYARGTDLDHLVALLGVERLVITPADEETDTPAVKETDDDLRKRAQLAPEGFSVAGPAGAYKAAALGADGRVRDAAAKSPTPGAVLITVLSREEGGAATDSLLAAVATIVSSEDARPLTDLVTVQSAEIVEYRVEATLVPFPGPDKSVALAEARKRLDTYVDDCHYIGRQVVISGLHAALHVDGIERVILAQPATDVLVNDTQAPYCIGISIVAGAADE